MQELIGEIERLRKDLNNTITELNKVGYTKAKAEYLYRVALAKEILLNKDRGLPATLNSDVSRGNEIVAKCKFNRDVAESLYDSTYERLRAIKVEIGIVTDQMNAIRKGE